LGMFMSVLDSVVITIALPAITSDFNADISLSQWTITGYLTAMTASIRLSASTLQSVVFFTILPQQSNNPNKIIIKVRYH
jgi:MFS family permease